MKYWLLASRIGALPNLQECPSCRMMGKYSLIHQFVAGIGGPVLVIGMMSKWWLNVKQSKQNWSDQTTKIAPSVTQIASRTPSRRLPKWLPHDIEWVGTPKNIKEKELIEDISGPKKCCPPHLSSHPTGQITHEGKLYFFALLELGLDWSCV